MIVYDQPEGIIHQGNALEVLRSLPDGSVNCCVTSPPYWNLRDYGVDGQLGLERNPFEYIENLVEICMEIHRALKDDGTFWLVIGETYCNAKGTAKNAGGRVGPGNCFHSKHKDADALPLWRPNKSDADSWGFKQKDLMMIPARVAIELQSRGWWLRSQIIWDKPNPMPSSVEDRPTFSHEYIFLLAKSIRYFYDHEAIREPTSHMRPRGGGKKYSNNSPFANRSDSQNLDKAGQKVYEKRNKRSVWTVSTKPFSGAHFATFPPDLIEPCILAGCPKGGTVLDPFFGAGTTGIVAYKHDRKFIGIELNEKYLREIAIPRIEHETQQLKLFN